MRLQNVLCLAALLVPLALAGCHADRDTGSAAASNDKADQKSRDAMLGKSMNVQDQHWASAPAASSTAATPATASSAASGAPASGGMTPSSTPASSATAPTGAAHH